MSSTTQGVVIGVAVALLALVYVRIWRKRGRLSPRRWMAEDPTQFEEKPPDELVTIAEFRTGLEAELAKGQLEAAGIEATVFGDILARTCGPPLGVPFLVPIELRVRAEDAQRALDALGTSEEEGDGGIDAEPPESALGDEPGMS